MSFIAVYTENPEQPELHFQEYPRRYSATDVRKKGNELILTIGKWSNGEHIDLIGNRWIDYNYMIGEIVFYKVSERELFEILEQSSFLIINVNDNSFYPIDRTPEEIDELIIPDGRF